MSEEFFKKHEDYLIKAFYYDVTRTFTVEELYQAFKERLIDELVHAERLANQERVLRTLDVQGGEE